MKKIKTIFIIFFALILIALPKIGLAASLYFSITPAEIRQSDVFVVEIKVSSPQEKINVADCILSFNKNILAVVSISTGGSVFNLWTKSPIFSNDTGQISFTGGAPNGFQGEEGKILKIVFLAKEKGQADLTFAGDSALYLNDGKGTKIQPKKESLNISVLERSKESISKDEWQGILANDKTPPSDPEIKLGQDPSVFDNKFFISFFAADEGSGVKSYEVKEGNRDFIKSESPYVLKDQSLKSAVLVRVTDNAGNYKIARLNAPLAPKLVYKNWWFLLTIIFALLVIFAAYFKLKKKYARK